MEDVLDITQSTNSNGKNQENVRAVAIIHGTVVTHGNKLPSPNCEYCTTMGNEDINSSYWHLLGLQLLQPFYRKWKHGVIPIETHLSHLLFICH